MLSSTRTFWLSLSIFCLALSTDLFAATISGRITDASSGKPIVFATVRIRELATEVHTDGDGKYLFNNIPAGQHTITVTFAGYSDYSIGVVETAADGAKTLDAALQPDVEPMFQAQPEEQEEQDLGEQIRPDARPEGKHSSHNSPIRLNDMPIRGYEDYVAIQSGTVRRFYGAPVHVRGGRIEEFGYDVDGFSQQDPFTGRSFTAINANTIDDIQVFSGYNNPSHGWLASGHTDVTTRETRATGGSFEAVTDNFHGEKSDYNLYALDVSGPFIAKSPGQLTYAVAGEYRTFGTRELGGTGDWNYLGSWHGNLRWRPSDRTSALLGTRGSYEDWKYTPRSYMFDAVHAPRGIDENYSVFGKLTHDIASRTSVSASVNWFSVSHRLGDGVHFDDIWAYGRPSGNPYADQTSLFFSWDDRFLDQDSLANGRYVPVHTPVVESTFTVVLPNGDSTQKSFIISGDEGTVWDDYYEQKGSYIGGRFELLHAHSQTAQALVGVEFQRHSVRAYNHLYPMLTYQGNGGGFEDINRFGYDEFGSETDDDEQGAKHPVFISAYASDQLSLDGLSLNFGARVDHFDYDAVGLVDPQQPLDPFDRATYADTATGLTEDERNDLLQSAEQLEDDELTEVDAITRLSPRLSALIALGDDAKLRFTFGKYIQRPPFRNLYFDREFLEYKVQTGGYTYAFGNPSVKPVERTTYEAGWTQMFGSALTVDMSAYMSDMSHLISPSTQPAIPNRFTTFADMGSAIVKGVEIGAQVRPARGVVGQLGYTISDISDDDRTVTNTQSNIAWTSAEPLGLGQPFTFEQKHRFVAILDVRSGPGDGPMIGETHILANSGVSVLFEAASGFPYSPVFVYNEVTLGSISPRPSGPLGSERTPATYRVDLKANKAFSIQGADLELYLWVINLFNRDNVVDVYNGSGQPDNTGWLDTPDGQQFVAGNNSIHDSSFLTGEQKYLLRQNDPANFDIARQIRFGMRVGF